uniref:Uncharacterized protein n=1 Tax=viral metagenome TaxID=1070528 RepID=A0A6C0JX71_9ZZZZ
MTTVVTINSLQRYNFDNQITSQPNPFDFILPIQVTSNWVFEKTPFVRATRFNVTEGYKVKACKVMIPRAFVPDKQPLLFLEIKASGIPIIDKTIGPHIKNINIIGYTGVTGITGGCCVPYPSELPNYNNTWALTPCGNTDTHYLYESCGTVSLYTDWRGVELHVKIRDLSGYVLDPPYPPANGYTGFGNMCDFSMEYTPDLSCKPSPCSPNFAQEFLEWKNNCASKNLELSPNFGPFFQQYNQVMIILVVEYVEIVIEGDGCDDQ